MPKTRHRTDAQRFFAANLRRLVDDHGDTHRSLGKRAKVSPRQVGYILTLHSVPTIETADALAGAYGLEGWQLQIADLPLAVLKSPALGAVLRAFLTTDDAGRDLLGRLAAREAKDPPPPP